MDIQLTIKDSNGFISLGLTDNPKRLTGIDLLVQIVALKILKTLDQDVFDPKEGTGIRSDIGTYNFAQGDIEEVRLMIIEKVKKVELEIIVEQGTSIGTVSERLRELRVLDLVIDPDNASVAARIQVINESGNTKDIVV